jgi:hypothetical protein
VKLRKRADSSLKLPKTAQNDVFEPFCYFKDHEIATNDILGFNVWHN